MKHARISPALFAALALLWLSGAAWADLPIHIEADTEHSGNVDSRNSPIRIDDGVSVDGNISSRNGVIRIGDGVSARSVSARNGAITIGEDGRFRDIDSRNGSITLGNGSEARDIEARNGPIRIGQGNRLRSLDNRNGAIELGEGTEVARHVETRNGAIQIGESVTIGGNAQTRNGIIHLREGSTVEGGVASRNGSIRLVGSRVGVDVGAISGDIVLEAGSEVGGNVIIDLSEMQRSRGGFFGFWGGNDYPEAGSIRLLGGSTVKGDVKLLLPEDYSGRTPSVEVDADSRIEGTLRVDGRVQLEIADEDRIGRIETVNP